jgi:hypothetical protein
LRWLNNITGWYLAKVSLLLIGQPAGIGPASHWLEDCANFTSTPEENDQYSQTTLSAIQAASQLINAQLYSTCD